MNVFVYILLLFCSVQYCRTDETLGQVIFANILFRHGDRTPIEPYPNDPYKNESLWPVPFGHLTNTGKHQHLMLGRWLRNRYTDLLPLKYSVYDIYVSSTDVDRTLMSAEANLAGLYPPAGAEIWDIKSWMPIPVHTVPEKEDYILAGKKYCDRYAYELQKVLSSPEMKKINEDNAELYQYLSEMAGKEISSLQTVEFLYNTLYIEELYNKTLPAWTKTVYPDKMKPLADLSFSILAYNKILQRLKIGPLLNNMIEHMKLKSKHALFPNRKLWIYSAHDSTVASFLMTLGLFEPHCPPYASAILVELRIHAQNGYVVTMFYKNSTGEPNLLTLPGCTAACPLSQFIGLTKDVTPNDWEKECLMPYKNYTFSVNAFSIMVAVVFSILMVFILAALLGAYVYWRDKREHNRYYTRI